MATFRSSATGLVAGSAESIPKMSADYSEQPPAAELRAGDGILGPIRSRLDHHERITRAHARAALRGVRIAATRDPTTTAPLPSPHRLAATPLDATTPQLNRPVISDCFNSCRLFDSSTSAYPDYPVTRGDAIGRANLTPGSLRSGYVEFHITGCMSGPDRRG